MRRIDRSRIPHPRQGLAESPSAALADPVRAGRDVIALVEADVARAGGAPRPAASAGSAADLARAAGRVAEVCSTLSSEGAGAGEVLAQAGRHLGLAGMRCGEAARSALPLAGAAGEIDALAAALSGVARRAHLAALQATVEAARLGEAGEGTLRLAQAVRILSAEGSRSAAALRGLGDRAGAAAGAIAAARAAEALVGGLGPVLDTLTAASRGQAATAADLAAEAAAMADALDTLAEAEAPEPASPLGARVVAALRQAELGDRRLHDRYPVDLPARVGTFGVGRVRDLGRGGLLLAPPEGLRPTVGTPLALAVRPLGQLRVTVVGVSARGLHCAFAEPISEAVRQAAARIEAEHRPLVATAQAGAAQIGAALEAAIGSGLLGRDALFDDAYRPLPGTDPPRFLTAALPALEEILPPILEPLLIADERLAHCFAVDRHGYAPVHNRRFSQAPRPDDPAWTARHSRHRRFHDDPAGLTAARSTRPFVVQMCRPEGQARPPLREIAVPIRVHGRHWGGLRMGYRL
ncbi:chemotaxis protein [Methylobacterium oryzisoli]|uniref:chemotaxis protein n=1 Tax=Methylobacterium oryzisoli TaxID=3385502 RepID=UPI0038914DC7